MCKMCITYITSRHTRTAQGLPVVGLLHAAMGAAACLGAKPAHGSAAPWAAGARGSVARAVAAVIAPDDEPVFVIDPAAHSEQNGFPSAD